MRIQLNRHLRIPGRPESVFLVGDIVDSMGSVGYAPIRLTTVVEEIEDEIVEFISQYLQEIVG